MISSFDSFVEWWLRPVMVSSIAWVRFGLGLMTAFYFSDALTDIGFWFGVDGVHSSRNVADFLERSGLQEAAAASLSPLFLTDRFWIYQAYCFIGIAIAIAMMLGRGGRWICVAAWLSVVFWANRLLWLAGLTETILCLSLFATCFAPAWKIPIRNRREQDSGAAHEASIATAVSIRLLAIEGTLIAIATWLSMLAGDVWWNGTGAIALAAPESVRSFALVDALRSPWIHELLTLAILVAMPLGLWLAWRGDASRRRGFIILVGWAITIAILGSHWLYGGTMACSFIAIHWAAMPEIGTPSEP